tara:strand:- start:818 stop:1690 length:873 start_codon:yes stop_codon:yes gene_type:complete
MANLKPYGFTGSVKVRSFRETIQQVIHAATVYCIFPDGTRLPMKPIFANERELRGFYARHGKYHYFSFRFTSPNPIDPRAVALGQDRTGHIAFMLKEGQSFWRETRDIHVPMESRWEELHQYVRFVMVQGQDTEFPVVVLHRMTQRETGTSRSTLEELPINKFLEDYNPNASFLSTEAERRNTFRKRAERRLVSEPQGLPFPHAVSELMLLKCMLKFRALHRKAQERKFAPGGSGHKRLLEGETAKTMSKRPCQGGGSSALVPVVAILTPQADGSYTGTFRFQGPREEGV